MRQLNLNKRRYPNFSSDRHGYYVNINMLRWNNEYETEDQVRTNNITKLNWNKGYASNFSYDRYAQ